MAVMFPVVAIAAALNIKGDAALAPAIGAQTVTPGIVLLQLEATTGVTLTVVEAVAVALPALPVTT